MSVPKEMLARAAFIFINTLVEDVERPRRRWRYKLYEERSGSFLLDALQFQSGHYKNFTEVQRILNTALHY